MELERARTSPEMHRRYGASVRARRSYDRIMDDAPLPKPAEGRRSSRPTQAKYPPSARRSACERDCSGRAITGSVCAQLSCRGDPVSAGNNRQRLFAKKACGLGSPPVTAALLACAELAGVAHGYAPLRASPPPSYGDRVGGPRSRPKPERRRSGHYRNDQPRGLWMVTNAGSQLAANGDRSHTRVTLDGTADRLPDIANSGLPPESRPGIVRLIRHALKDRETSGREGNIRRNHLEAEHGPGRRRLVQAPPAVSPHHARESTGACHPAARYHSPKRTSRHAIPSL